MVFLLLSPLFALMLHLNSYYGLLFIIVTALIGIYGTIYNSALIGWEHFFPSAIAAVAGSAGKFIAGYIIVLFFPTADAVIFSFIIGALVGLVAYLFFHKQYFPRGGGEVRSDDWRQKYYAKFAFGQELGYVFVFALLMLMLGNIDIFLVKSLTSAEMTGFYGALHTLGLVILTLNTAIIGAVLPTAYAAGHEGNRAAAKTVFFAYGAIAIISLGGFFLYSVFPSLIVRMLFGAKYISIASNLWLFAPLTFFLSVLMLEANFAYARHAYRVSWVLLGVIAAATVGVALFHASIREIALAITAAFALGYAAVLSMNLLSHKKRFLEAQPLADI
jgi:O-antigen/teichoic acid export membrane protein